MISRPCRQLPVAQGAEHVFAGVELRAHAAQQGVANEVSPAMSVFPVQEFLLVILGQDAV
jgi:hypothetical protein